jgi:hypothetical protein
MRSTGAYASRTILAAFLVAFATPALAATVVCAGNVALLGYHANGHVMLQLSSMNTWTFAGLCWWC